MVQRDQDPTFLGKCKRWVNLGQVVAANMYDYWQELQTPLQPFSSVKAQETYYMPSDFDKPTRIWDYTNNKKMTIQTREEYVDANIASVSAKTTGQPQYVSLYGISAVKYVNSASFSVQAKSSNVNDIAGCVVHVEGWLDSALTILGYTDIVVSSGAPTTYVIDPNAIVFYGVTRITKSLDTTGYITLADQAGTPNVLGTISPHDRESRYPVLYLGLIPSGINTYNGTYKRRIKKMADDNDYPFAEISDFLHLYALGWAYMQEKETVPRAQVTWDKAKELLREQIRNEQDKLGPDFQHKFVPQNAQAHRF